jgi:hypothetical protein
VTVRAEIRAHQTTGCSVLRPEWPPLDPSRGKFSVARSRVVSTGAELHVTNLIRSYSVPWNDVSSFERVDDGSVEVRSASGRAIRLGALSVWRFQRRRGWRRTALTELKAILEAHQHVD